MTINAARIVEHPLRAEIFAEVHARPIEIVDPETRVRRLVFLVGSNDVVRKEIHRRFLEFCNHAGAASPIPEGRQHTLEIGTRRVTWEFHTEFLTVTWRSNLSDKTNLPDDIGLNAVGEGQLIGAMRFDVTTGTEVPERLLPGFQLNSLCVADLQNGQAQVVTDFVPDADFFVRFEFAAGGLTAMQRSIHLRYLLEIETYRTMALLGLPLARRHTPSLQSAELALGQVVATLPAATTTEKAQVALSALHDLSVHSGELWERMGYRFAASNAYGNILYARLRSLNEKGTDLGSTLGDYIGNRVQPALATCLATEDRLRALSKKIERTIGLLNVRIGLDLQIHNRAILETIAKTSQSQFQLQRTVEGLSAMAISYYSLGIIGIGLGAPARAFGWDLDWVMAAATPLVLGSVLLIAHRVRRVHFSLRSE